MTSIFPRGFQKNKDALKKRKEQNTIYFVLQLPCDSTELFYKVKIHHDILLTFFLIS